MYKKNFDGEDGTFGNVFDRVMQRMNYNETNGIVIGPEFSRIFAEIILQHIDCSVKRKLEAEGFVENEDYLCYRYVDDYFLFYENDKLKERAMRLFDAEMKEYKLSISESKTKQLERPFVTEISIAKQSIDKLIKEYLSFHDGKDVEMAMVEDDKTVDEDGEENIDLTKERVVKALENDAHLYFRSNHFISKYKSIIKTTGVGSKDVVNYTLARIERKLVSVLKQYDKVFKCLSMGYVKNLMTEECMVKKMKLERVLTDYLIQLTDVVFFLYADCKRIKTTLKVMTILNDIIIYLDNDYHPAKDEGYQRFSNVIRDAVFRNIQKEIDTVFRISKYNAETPLETLYLLITIRSMRDKYRINQDVIDSYLGLKYDSVTGDLQSGWPKMNALVIILLLYYYGGSDKFLKQKKGLVKIIRDKYETEPKETIKRNAELVILLLDLLACPYIRNSDRRCICKLMGVSRPNQKIMEEYLKKRRYMFTRWTDVNLTKELGAKVSLEVYS